MTLPAKSANGADGTAVAEAAMEVGGEQQVVEQPATVIPSAEAIAEAKRRRQQAREEQDFIPMSTSSGLGRRSVRHKAKCPAWPAAERQ